MNAVVLTPMADKVRDACRKNIPSGLKLSWSQDAVRLVEEIESKGFTHDKLFVALKALDAYDSIQRKSILDRYINVAKNLKPTQSAIFLDSANDYSDIFALEVTGYPNIEYLTTETKAENLPDIILGKHKTSSAPHTELGKDRSQVKNIKGGTAPTKGGRKLFGRKEPKPVEPVSQPAPLEVPEVDTGVSELEDILNATTVEPVYVAPPVDTAQQHITEHIVTQNSRQSLKVPTRSRVVVVTGERRSGVTSICANIGLVAAKQGWNVLMVDIDFVRKGLMLAFPAIIAQDDMPHLTSVANALRQPASLADYTLPADDGLEFLSLDLSINDVRGYAESCTPEKLQKLIATATTSYDLILIDMPFDKLKAFSPLISMASTIIHVMNNDMNALFNLVTMVDPDNFEDRTDYQLYVSKIAVVLNACLDSKWNNTPINAKSLVKVLIAMTDDDSFDDYMVLGEVPFIGNYNSIIEETDLPANKEYSQYYLQLLRQLPM